MVQLLRESLDSITLVVSRQEVEEEQQEVEVGVAEAWPIKDVLFPPPPPPPFLLALSCFFAFSTGPIHFQGRPRPSPDGENSGPTGLGVTVYSKSTSSKVGGKMGVYIKSIVPGGAAAMVSQN